MFRRASYLVLLVGVSLVVACSGRPYKMQDVAIDTSRYEILGDAEGNSTGIHLFGIIPIGLNDKVERAIARAVAARGGGQLVNATVHESWFWGYVLNGYKVNVQGTVIKAK